MSISQILLALFAVMIIAGAIISFGGFLVDSDESSGNLLSGNPGIGNELAFFLVLIGAVGLVGTFLLRGLPNPWGE